MQWVRRWEVLSGLGSIAVALAFWDSSWWQWGLLAVGLLAVSPWGGAATILRKAERDPSVLIADPERRRARARRFAFIAGPAYAVVGAVVGYVIDGWGLAIFVAACSGLAAAAGAWWNLNRG